jgi:putative FmdB family regulatory protein
MPTYAYRCQNGHQFDLFQKITDKPKARCPTCGGRASRIISGGAGLIFKGSGFYITDYGKDGKGPRKAEKPDAAETGSKSEAPTDAQPSPGKGKAKESTKKPGKAGA